MHRILIIDDNQAIHADFRKILAPAEATAEIDSAEALLFGGSRAAAAAAFEVDSALQGQEGLEMVRAAVGQNKPYAVAFVDMRMPPGWDGLQTIEALWQADSDIQVVICSAY